MIIKNIIYLLTIFIILFIFLILWYGSKCRSSDELHLRGCNKNKELTKDGIHYTTNFLNENECNLLKNKFGTSYNTNTVILDKDDNIELYDKIINYCKYITGNELYPVHKIDQKQMWIRYYDQDVWNPFENFHIDRKRYNCSAKQFRAVYCLYNNSDGTFISKDLKCTPNKIEIPTIENSLMIIESEELVHRVHFTKGKRIMIMCDFTTSLNRGLHGYIILLWDNIWVAIQKIITSK